ncbi:hypothetical protein GCM10009119_39160 [Algoriphagus jejuensis]|uniref:Uncharacterized protein n=1 Tax=Algoriphagus jejuensis TaxID=419934 RepID=A0ABP3YHF6_9BACT
MAQVKNDIVVLSNGEMKEGKVTGVTDSKIKFRYAGEELEYEFSKSQISKIEFGSGRVETFGGDSGSAPTPTIVPVQRSADPARARHTQQNGSTSF